MNAKVKLVLVVKIKTGFIERLLRKMVLKILKIIFF